jgi:hypothetical protein
LLDVPDYLEVTKMNSASSHWQIALGKVRNYVQEAPFSPAELDGLERSVTDVYNEPLLALHTTDSLEKAQSAFASSNVDYLLIQDSPGTLAGILGKDSVAAAFTHQGKAAKAITAEVYMDRNICIEPETATPLEVLDRITIGCCPCTLIVDHNKGFPLFIISPRMLYAYLDSILTLPSFTSALESHSTANSSSSRMVASS